MDPSLNLPGTKRISSQRIAATYRPGRCFSSLDGQGEPAKGSVERLRWKSRLRSKASHDHPSLPAGRNRHREKRAISFLVPLHLHLEDDDEEDDKKIEEKQRDGREVTKGVQEEPGEAALAKVDVPQAHHGRSCHGPAPDHIHVLASPASDS
ncbi:hypothetical protein MGYG_08892 [Nannizzia gypsea CBS 118893]|uniref:Uncharacterized protein n=1 Tax=Arthroderma gypseum (strain ATCC MYA-4604 / CBS 118893) TaxID=535722 RepID=E5QZ85_ARTGP|nr:hypothetical protein MGYG_08892 [Nannizzia gypsea CBS 118893]EFQ97317.1 hypothetical protein MGYG_08892 [Nannizzia gypsea CBS 118893]